MELLQKAKKNLSAEAGENIEKWLKDEKYLDFCEEIETLILDEEWAELEDAFFKVLEFGTAGRRGKVGAGSNRMNEITIEESVQALCEYFSDMKIDSPSVVVAHDTRISSRKFAEISVSVLAANNVSALLFNDFRSTPELSFAVRHLKASAGIVISASHNPPEDNGIKVYWSDGAQISAPHDKNLMEIASKIEKVKSLNFIDSVNDGKIKIIGQEVDQAYILANSKLSLSENRNISIIYSPLHGAGMTNLFKTLQFVGFGDISLVEKQVTPDGNFPFVPENRPNPENPAANRAAILQLIEQQADVAFATDPDSDRLSVMSLEKDGNVKSFSGNESAVLVTEYILRKKQKNGELNGKQFIAKTIVTTDALNALANKFNVKIYDDMLVGFKYIGRRILSKESSEEFLVGCEESYGQLVGAQTRDKDAATAGLMLAELAAELKAESKTLGEKLNEIYDEIGYYQEETLALEFPGAAGFADRENVMTKLRSGELKFKNLEMSAILDYKKLVRNDIETNKETEISADESGDVIVLEFEGLRNKRLTIRPSGTEPKLKVYVQWFAEGKIEANEQISRVMKIAKEGILQNEF